MAPVFSRKAFLAQAAGAGILLVGGPTLQLHAAPARSPLTSAETRTLAAWCDLLVPGARDGRVGDFVNEQLAKHPDDALLGIRYFDWPPPWPGFYKEGLSALDKASEAAFGSSFAELRAGERTTLLDRLLDGSQAWDGPPFFLFYLVTRGDAVDVRYGVPSGYKLIGLPYVPQVAPKRPW